MIFIVALTGCVSLPRVAPSVPKSAPYRFTTVSANTNSNSLFVILTFSGGGTRAAAFAYGVLRELRNTPITWEGRKTTLLDEVDLVSSVSGGSFTAAYFGAFRDELFVHFERDFLYRANTAALVGHLLRPDNVLRLLFTRTNRTDIAATYYDEIFRRATLATIARAGRPFVVFNATDVSQGVPFEFTQETFDYLCGDVSAVPVARAVAASAAFPVLFAPALLQNHHGPCTVREPMALQNALSDKHVNPWRFRKATVLRSYEDRDARPFVHLIDGGVADNLGVHIFLDAMNEDLPIIPLRNYIQLGVTRKLVVIAVDASTESDAEMDRHRTAPSAITVLKTSAFAPMTNYSMAVLDEARMHIAETSADSGGATAYFIHLTFDDFPNRDVAEELRRVPTSLSLPRATVDKIRDAAQTILRGSDTFQRFLRDLQ
jgi:NTE family protein